MTSLAVRGFVCERYGRRRPHPLRANIATAVMPGHGRVAGIVSLIVAALARSNSLWIGCVMLPVMVGGGLIYNGLRRFGNEPLPTLA